MLNQEISELVKQNIFNALINAQAQLFEIAAENQMLRAQLEKLLADAITPQPDLSEQND